MLKPDSLRAALVAAVPELAKDPERLKIFVDKGRIASRMGYAPAHPQLSFEYRYRLSILIMDFAGHPDGIIIAMLAWLHVHQPDILQNQARSKEAIVFEADILDDSKVDLSIELELTEAVKVEQRAEGGFEATHVAEPPPIPEFEGVPRWTPLREIYRQGVLICSLADVDV
jgi:hypothetical protein